MQKTPRVRFVTFQEVGLTSRGKGRPIFYKKLCEACGEAGIDTKIMPYDDLVAEEPVEPGNNNVFLILNETNFVRAKPYARIDQVQAKLAELNNHVHFDPQHLETIGDKTAMNKLLRESGLPVPELISSSKAKGPPVFSNTNTGAANPTRILSAGEDLDLARYNTRFVDSTSYYSGEPYYICLRTMSVGTTPIVTVVRANPKSSGNPNVRNKTTPLDAAMLTHFHETITVPMAPQIEQIARGVGETFGLGFYSMDLIPEAATGRLYVSEVRGID